MQKSNTKSSRPAEKLRRAWLLFFFFFRIGFFTFGGGWSIIAQMTREFVEKRNWLTNEELMDMVSVAQSLPGIMIINCSVQFGYALGGVFCAFAAALGIALPSFIVLVAVTFCYNELSQNVYVARALVGVRAAVVPIIVSATLRLRKAALADTLGWVLAAFALLICLFTNLSRIVVILIGGTAGLLILSAKAKKEGKKEEEK
jgi:chromate transporter